MSHFLAGLDLRCHNGEAAARDQRIRQTFLALGGLAKYAKSGDVSAWWTDSLAYEAPSVIVDDGVLRMCAGDPVIPQEGIRNFEGGLSSLFSCLELGGHEALREARGSYCAVVVSNQGSKIVGVTDKLGVRALYFGTSSEFLFVTSSQQLAFSVLGDSARIDVAGALELHASGFITGDSTLIEGVANLKPGCTVEITKLGGRVDRYWNWSEELVSPSYLDADPAEFDKVFNEAVKLRIGKKRKALAFLSAGMDSRAVAAKLVQADVDVTSAGFGVSGVADAVLTPSVAAALGTRHIQIEVKPSSVQANSAALYSKMVAESGQSSEHADKQVWSGDGGSVLVGHVYLDFDYGLDESAPSQRLRQMYVSNQWLIRPGALDRHLVRRVTDRILENAAGFYREFDSTDAIRRMHYVTVATDQRWHLTYHHETVLSQGFELVLPFFDSEVAKWIFSRSADLFCKHKFYNAWADIISPSYTAVPWQAYPGHLAGRVAMPADVLSQWDLSVENAVITEGTGLPNYWLQAYSRLNSSPLLTRIYSVWRMRLMVVANLLGVRNDAWEVERMSFLADPLSRFRVRR